MKLHLLALCSLTVLTAAESFPQLEPHRAKYAQDRKALDDARAPQIEAVRARYIAALSAARADALKASKSGALAAVDAELAGAKADVHAAAMPAHEAVLDSSGCLHFCLKRMASIFRRDNSPYWFAAFRDADNRRVQRTTKQRGRGAALRIAQEWERLSSKGRRRTLTEAQARRVISEIVEAATGEALHFHSCRAWLTEWLAGKRGAVAARSLEKYEQVNTDFLKHLAERADLPLAGIGPKDVRSFRDALARKGRSPGAVNQTVRKVLSAPFAAALRLGYIPMNPCVAVEALKDDADAERETFTAEQVNELVQAAEGDWKGAVLCGYFTGLRLRDVADMRWECLDFDAGLLRVKTRKTGAVVTLPLHDEFATWLRTQRRGIGKAPIFPTLTGKGTGGRHGLSGRFSAIMEEADVRGEILRGADGKGRKTYSLTFHSLRHSFVSALANAGVSSELRRKLSGHADERSHARYTHHEMEALRTAMAKLPCLAG